MFPDKRQAGPSEQDTTQFLDLLEKTLTTVSLEDFAENTLKVLLSTLHAWAAFFCTVDSRLPAPQFFHNGLPEDLLPWVKGLCNGYLEEIPVRGDTRDPSATISLNGVERAEKLLLYPLQGEKGVAGILGIGLKAGGVPFPAEHWERYLRILSHHLRRLQEWKRAQRQLSHLNTYLTVSSMLAQSFGLSELLETALHCCMEVASATEASVLLLDDEKENFLFYRTEGPAKAVLRGVTIPAEKGLAGFVLRTRQSELINDVQNDPRFYGKVDAESGFKTRNMIAIPLVAGEEPIGVLEVLNKVDGGLFTEEEHHHLLSIAEEIAFAIRNARIFEYVVDSYCKQRQGQNSCKGCKRPLGSWTPCVKYRDTNL
ncbi:MAG: GAF domain-containing protein [Deltaproteobacteria bacterium]|nr:GAF domain-containing protein [Deltaproteobacteria bacterium]